ncbi:MAG: hypothetical protein JWN44_1363 [Myxococcales bacterium]|nr:hypothetical protein [Myxococcales bacterium]
MYKLRSVLRNAAAALTLLGLAACAGKGCSCVTPIKGGFPVDKRRDNAIQIRATQSMLKFVSDNGPKLIPGLIGGNTFNVPPSCGGSTEICCKTPNMVCTLNFDFKALSLTPTAPNLLKLSTDVVVKTVKPLPINAPILGACDVTIDTTKGSPQTMNATSDLAFTVDKTTNTTRISAANTAISIQDAAIDLTGGIGCAIANTGIVKPIVVSILQGQVATQLENTISQQACSKCTTKDDCNSFATTCTGGTCMQADGKTCVPSLGLEGRMDVGSMLATFSPGLDAHMDIFAVAGGYAAADTGLSLGLLGGGLGDPHSSCVPSLPPPPTPAIAQSKTFYTDVLPDKATPYHLGIGVHKTHLDTLGWSAFDAGALCLHIGTPSVALLSSKTIGVLIPSLSDVVHVGDAPMYLSLKPSQPPTFTLGKGTYKTDAMGRVTVDDALLHIKIPSFAIDFFAFADDRYVRIMTLNADVELPLSLDVDADGKLNPVFGDLTKAFTNVTVTNSDLLAEAPDQLAQAFPMLLGVAVGQLTGALKGIALPAIMGLNVKPIAVTSTDPDKDGQLSFLSIFANLSVATTRSAHATTEAWLESMQLPPTAEFAVDARGSTVPAAVLQLGGHGTGALEYSWSVDGGPWSAYSAATRVTVTDPQLWMQGHHAVDVRARVVDQPGSADPSPVRLDVIVDTIAPTGGFDVAGRELRVTAKDLVSPPEAMQLRFAAGAAGFGPWIASDHVIVPTELDSATVRVQVRDEAGNIGELGFHGRTTGPSASGCNCDLAGRGDMNPTLPMFAVVGLALALARRRRVWLRRIAIAGGAACMAATVLAASGCGSHLAKGDFEAPVDEIGRFHDVAVDNGTLHVSAYDDSYGDLVYAEISDATKNPSWQVVDGVDREASPDREDGYRFGISDPGPDVGQYTSIALSQGKPIIAYYDVTNHALKVARGGHPFDVQTIDSGSSTVKVGLYNAISVDGDGHPTVAYVATGMPAGDHFTSELRVATATSASPSASDWSISVVDSTQISCAGRCSSSTACIVPAMVGGMPNGDTSLSTCVPVDSAPCATACTVDTQACIKGTCTNILAASKAPDLVEGIGLYVQARRTAAGQLVLVYYDREQGDLKMATGGPGAWTLSFIDGQSAATDVGQFATVALGSDDSIHVAYVDAIHDALVYKHVAGGTVPMTAEVIDDGARADGPHSVGAGANLVLDAAGNPRVVYQDQHTADLELATRPAAWSHSDLHTGIGGFGFYPHQVVSGGKLYLTEFVYDRQNGGAPLGTLQISVTSP